MRLAGVQFLAVAYWWLLRKPDGVDLAAIPLAAWAAGVPLFAFGQVIKQAAWLKSGRMCLSRSPGMAMSSLCSKRAARLPA
jgi:hypothetical protein